MGLYAKLCSTSCMVGCLSVCVCSGAACITYVEVYLKKSVGMKEPILRGFTPQMSSALTPSCDTESLHLRDEVSASYQDAFFVNSSL